MRFSAVFAQAQLQAFTDVAPIVPAQGWVFNQKGEVTLIAKEPNFNPQSLGFTPTFCHNNL